MKKILNNCLATLAILIFTLTVAFCQQVHILKGNEYFDRFAYSEAISEYESALRKKPELTDIKIKLAECYRLTGGTEKAEFWYQEIVKSNDAKPVYKLYYGQALMNNNHYDKAKLVLREYQKENPLDTRAAVAIKTIDNLPEYFKDTASVTIKKLGINSANGDFSPVQYDNGIVFASSRETSHLKQKMHEWTGQPFLNLYYAKGNANSFSNAEPFAPNVQVKYNDGPVSFSKDGKEIYITRNNIEKGKVYKSSDKVVKLKLFYAKKENGTWREEESFKYNDPNFSCAHAALSPDGTRLFFTSDMPGGKGGMDLYVCKRDSGGWGKPENLGDKINTIGNELFPYLHEDGTFIFSSNGRDGLGGLDVYWCKIKNDVIVAEAKNLGAPVNSSEDDFGVTYNTATNYGYFSTNRELKNANDDIYSFKRSLKVEGVVVKKGTETPVAEARVVLKTENKVDVECLSKTDGTFEFPLETGKDYAVEASKKEWSMDVAKITTQGMFPLENIHVKLQLEKTPSVKEYNLIVHVIDKDTKKPIQGADIGLDQTDKTLGYSDEKGNWLQPLKPNTNIHLIVTKPSYTAKVIYFSNEGEVKEKDHEILVELIKADDIGPYARWYKIIYFDFDKSNVRPPDATKTMAEVADFLKEHPDARLLMNSYCDARGTAQYNMKLSRRRAEGATQWLVEHGIERKMVEKMEWGGESMLINRCADGKACTEAEHALNRRTEIRVVRVERGLTMKK